MSNLATPLCAEIDDGASAQAPSTLLARLKQMASSNASADRLSVLRSITDLYFVGAGQHSDAEVYLFNDIMERIADQISREGKIEFANTLASDASSPHGIVRKLAFDSEIDVAKPVIQHSAVLVEEDLIQLAQEGPQSHLEALADRDFISAPITDMLIERGNQRVLHSVSANRTAEISLGGFRQLAQRALDDVRLQGVLIDRPDLSTEAIDKLLPVISRALAAKLKVRGCRIPEASADTVLASARNQFTVALDQRKKDNRSVVSMVSMVEAGKMSLEQAVNAVVQSERLLDAATVLSHFVKLDRSTVFKMLAQGPPPAIAILCRSLGFQWTTLEALLALRAKKQRVQQHYEAASESEYGAMDDAASQRVIRFWQVRAHVAADEPGNT